MKWPLVNLPDICRPRQWPTIQKTEMLASGFVVYGANGPIGYYSAYNHEEPTVLITCRGATCGSINVSSPKSYVTGNAMALDDLNESRIDLNYLVLALRNADFSSVITGDAQPQITGQSLARFQIPLPPLAEQKRIAGILDAADALRAKRRESLAQLDALLQSTFLTLFGDPVSNPMGWPTSSFENCIQDRTSSAIKIPKSDFQPEGQWQIIDQSQNEIAGYSNIGPPFKESLPAVVFGDHTRCVKLVREPFLFGADGAKLLIPYSQMLAVFLSHLLPLLKLPDLGYSRHMREVKRLVYILPPLALQQRFAAVVESVERQKSAQRAHLAELDALFAALQHRAFRGEL